MSDKNTEKLSPRELIHEVIFEADTRAGIVFDVVLLIAILLSVVVVMLETTASIAERFGNLLYVIEWVLTIFFTIEYVLRLYVVHKPIKYATSFYGIVDLLAILPTYLSIFFVGAQSLLVIRILRLLRVFRIFKLMTYLHQGRIIALALRASAPKILVFISVVVMMVTICGSIMYLVEGGVNSQYDSIPRAIYWAIVTLTTVGYGDISPVTSFGQFIAAFVMILGYSVIAVPTGIVSAEFVEATSKKSLGAATEACRGCGAEGHRMSATFCFRCGEVLHHHHH